MTTNYVLDKAGNPVPEPDLMKWANWYKKSGQDRIIAKTKINPSPTGNFAKFFHFLLGIEVEDVGVSTVFLSIDHNYSDEGLPLLYETMVFGGKYDGEMWRYSTRTEAEAGHDQAVALVKEDKG